MTVNYGNLRTKFDLIFLRRYASLCCITINQNIAKIIFITWNMRAPSAW